VFHRRAGNRRLSDACRKWAFSALTVCPGVVERSYLRFRGAVTR
jgi:hypothetical protein